MAAPASYITNLNNINDAMKRHNDQLKNLRQKRKQTEAKLYEYMTNNNIDELDGYKREKLKPKERMKPKKKTEKRADAIKLFAETGVNDPEYFWDLLQNTQRHQKPNNPDD